ncbi:MAG TPA: hypothetical protein VG478_00690 [Acidimicrobiales bacterium]|jgi:hypothetical protein|nr:hypothetical protein [Acidimicrobiales bacterium]
MGEEDVNGHFDSGPAPDNVRLGYQTATQFAVYDGQLSWQVTGIFVQFGFVLIFGATFPSFVGDNGSEKVLAFAGLGVSVAGWILTAMFGSMVSRIRTYEGYWVSRAAEYEAQFRQTNETIRGSIALSKDHEVTVNGSKATMPRYAIVSSRYMLNAMFLAFLLAFMVLIGVNAWRVWASF